MENAQQEVQTGQGDRVSDLFDTENSNCTIRSSDGVLYKVRSEDLSAFSGGFPDTGILRFTDPTGVVQLTEPSLVLDIVLQLLRNERPKVQFRHLPPETIVLVAEAVEKYHITQSLEMCYICMEKIVQLLPFKVLEYAYKHNYPDLADLAAPFTLREQFDYRNPPNIHRGALLNWLLWRNEPQLEDAKEAVINLPSNALRFSTHNYSSCSSWDPVKERIAAAIQEAAEFEDILPKLESALPRNIIGVSYTCCVQASREWKTAAKAYVEGIRPFSHYMRNIS